MTRDDEITRSAMRVIDTQARAIQALGGNLGGDFSRAVNMIGSTKGRVIIGGIGKSGHIARKIAATMASTGTPAFFVHPAEASHGDLGMIAEGDVLMLLSNSGETAELKDMIYHAKRFSIPLIAIVRRESSTLANAADIAFVLPEIEECSPVNAPTTSTTMMLVFGDALAVALLEMRGFKAEDFRIFHPGGKLGSQLLSVNELMCKGDSMPTVTQHTKMSDALLVISSGKLGCAAVLDENVTLTGLITDGDLRRHMDDGITLKTAAEVMTKNPVTAHVDMLASQALAIMNERNITQLLITENGSNLMGILHIHHLLNAGV